ncbi:MAG TPA: TetR/AcrR family transcriptional regulator [Bryobacteraceae bacterium]|nr:TetR/AcrR family transcriptional regulator [Bryobacteraceae bacterium]
MTVVTNLSRRERKKIASRERIVAEAIELFSRHGIAEVTVDQIAAAADIGKGTIYNYFETKEDIIVAFLVGFEPEVQDALASLMRSQRPVSTILTEFITRQFKMKEPYHAFVRVFLAQMLLRTQQFLPYMVEMQKTIDPPLEKLFTTLLQRGAIRTDVAIPELVMVFKTIQLGLTALWAVEGPPFKGTESVVKQEMMLFAKGLESRK